MKYTILGNTDIQVSKICLGTMTFGEQNTEEDAHIQLNYAISKGINFIDTAELYAVPSTAENNGLTEKYIGTWLKDRTDRDQLIIATKIAGPATFAKYIRDPLRFTPDQIRIAIEGSLQRLQTDYVDLYQLHWPERKTNFFGKLGYVHDTSDEWEDNMLEILQTFSTLIQEGKIRYFGVSNETPWGMMRYLHLADKHDLPRCVSIQNPYSLLNRTFEVGLAEIAIREQAGLLAYSPMAFGLLSGKYHQDEKPNDARLTLYPRMARYNGHLSYDATSKYIQIAEKYGFTLAQLSLAFVNSQPFLTSNIIGATTMDQLKENIDSIDIELSEDILKEIDEVHTEIPNPAP